MLDLDGAPVDGPGAAADGSSGTTAKQPRRRHRFSRHGKGAKGSVEPAGGGEADGPTDGPTGD